MRVEEANIYTLMTWSIEPASTEMALASSLVPSAVQLEPVRIKKRGGEGLRDSDTEADSRSAKVKAVHRRFHGGECLMYDGEGDSSKRIALKTLHGNKIEPCN